MKKRYVIVPVLLMLCAITVVQWNKTFLMLWNANTIVVTAEPPLVVDKLSIRYGNGATTINRKSDAELFTKGNFHTTLYHGEKAEQLPNEYGENDFLITYDDKYYVTFRHFKLNRREQHDYHFHVTQQGSTVMVTVEIQGAFHMTFDEPMHVIKQAHQVKP